MPQIVLEGHVVCDDVLKHVECSLSIVSLYVQGREDLHLDERLMQMLRSANTALQADELSAYRALHVCTFAVVPLGPKTGLIEWVDLSAPLFGIYQAWQRRSASLPGRTPSFRTLHLSLVHWLFSWNYVQIEKERNFLVITLSVSFQAPVVACH